MRSQLLFCIAFGLLFANCVIPIHGQTSISSKAPLSYTTDPQAPLGSEKHPVRVSSGIMLGNSIRRDMPKYPSPPRCGEPLPENWKGSGVTVLHTVINPEGKVYRMNFISGIDAFREPVMDAVRNWTFKPYLLNGIAAWVETTITLEVQMGCSK